MFSLFKTASAILMLIYSIVGSIARTSLTRRCWFQPISARCGLDKPTARLISHGESNYLGSPPEYMPFLWGPRHVQPHFIVRRAGLLWSQQDFEWRWSVPLFKCLTVLEFSFILFDLCLLITFFNFIMNYVPIVTFWIFTYHKIWILSIMFCSIWSYWIIYFLACLEVSWRVVS